METKFINKYVRDEEWAKDAFFYVHFKRPIIVAIDVVLSIYFVFGIIDGSALFVAFSLIFPVIQLLTYRKNVKLSLERDIELHKQPIEVSSEITDELIHITHSTGTEPNRRTVVSYDPNKK